MTEQIPSYRSAASIEEWVRETSKTTGVPAETLKVIVNELKPGSFAVDDQLKADVLKTAIMTHLGREKAEDSAYLNVFFPFRGELAAHYQYAWGSHNATALDDAMRESALAIGAEEGASIEWDEEGCVTMSSLTADPKDDVRIAGRLLREVYECGFGNIVEIAEVFNDDREHSWAEEMRPESG